MKIKFIYPKFDKFLETYPELAEMPAIASIWSFTMPPALGIPIMAGSTPDNVEWHVQDQNIEDIIFDDDSDFIAISYFTPQASYAYEIGDEFIRRGKTVIMGGMHPSMLPSDASKHCNSLCIGEVDTLWNKIIQDFQKGQLKPIYRSSKPPAPDEIKSPKQDVFNNHKYDWQTSLVSITRGCPYNCSWCNIPIYQGREIRFRPLKKAADDIKKLSGKEFYITDDTLMLNRESTRKYLLELCNRIKDYNVRMFLSCSPALNNNFNFLNTIARSGCKNLYMVFGSDTVSKMFYTGNKLIWEKSIDLVKTIEDCGIHFFGSFSLGYDFSEEKQFDLILDFCEKAKIKTAEFFIATPFPNTPFWEQLKHENRLIQPIDWKKYNCANVVFNPKLITEQKLLDGFLYLWKSFYKNATYDDYLSTFHTLYQKAKMSKRKEFNNTKNNKENIIFNKIT